MRLCLALTLLLACLSAAAGYEVGDMVVVIHDADVKVDYRIVDKVTAGTTLKIEAVEDDRVQVNDGSPGWINANDVVLQDKAIAHFDAAIAKNPNDAVAYRARGRVWQNRKEHDRAVAEYDEAVRLDPKDAWARALRGEAWYSKQEFKKSLADFDEALKLDPELAWAYSARGDVWARQGEYDKAIADFSDALQLDPHQVWALRVASGNALVQKGRILSCHFRSERSLAAQPGRRLGARGPRNGLADERRPCQGR